MSVVCIVLQLLQKLVVSAELVGEALVPYYRQILPILNCSRTKPEHRGRHRLRAAEEDVRGEPSWRRCSSWRCTEEDAFINIKYMVPTYELHQPLNEGGGTR